MGCRPSCEFLTGVSLHRLGRVSHGKYGLRREGQLDRDRIPLNDALDGQLDVTEIACG